MTIFRHIQNLENLIDYLTKVELPDQYEDRHDLALFDARRLRNGLNALAVVLGERTEQGQRRVCEDDYQRVI
jgi:hypothetical protein